MTKRRKLRDGFAPAALALALLVAPSFAEEESPPSDPEVTIDGSSEPEAWIQAQDYSLENIVIAYAVYGRTPRYSGEEIVAGLNEMLREQGMSDNEIQAWTANTDHMGVGIGFYVDGVELNDNTLSLTEAAAGIPHFVEMYREHAPLMRERRRSPNLDRRDQ